MNESPLRETFNTLKIQASLRPYSSVKQRISILKNIRSVLQSYAEELAEAVSKDFSGRDKYETSLLEIFPTIKAISYCIKNLEKWSKIRKRSVSWLFQPAKAMLLPQPLGVVGIMVPWNYPIYLSLVPAAYALAAGNQVMIKISELTPHFGQWLADKIAILNRSNRGIIAVINGEIEVAKEFSQLPFDHLLFTGSTEVGKQVMTAASSNLTPVTLELGGKSPAIISKSATENTIERLLMGKAFNAGQTCIAPDYLLVDDALKLNLKELLQSAFNRHYPEGVKSRHYTSIISQSHYERLQNLLEDAKKKGAEIVPLTTNEKDGQKFPLTLLYNVNPDMHVMQEEIFGPLLPVMTYNNLSEAIDYINEHNRPLALYYFGSNKKEISRLRYETHSGALTINDTIMHIGIDDLPFGGVGSSGMGRYHGQEGFDTFSHLKPIFIQRRISPITWFYPPYGSLVHKLLRYVGGIKSGRNNE